MRPKLVLSVISLLLFVALAFEPPAIGASAQEAMMKKGESGPTAATSRPQRNRRRARRGVPKGVHNCIDRLIEIATADPLVDYAGQPEQIVNNGLLWNDPKSNCYVGDDGKLRLKISEMANAWRAKDASKVRSMLQEIKSAAPQS
jgi:hypothetical protein